MTIQRYWFFAAPSSFQQASNAQRNRVNFLKMIHAYSLYFAEKIASTRKTNSDETMIQSTNRSPWHTVALILAIVAMTGCTQLAGQIPAAESTNPGPSPAHAITANDTNGPISDNTPTKSPLTESTQPRIFKGTGVMVNSSPKKEALQGPANVSLNFEGADIRDIAKTILAEILRVSYIVDPRVTGSISFRTTQPLSRDALLPTLETVLRMNGIVMIKENEIFKIMPIGGAKGSLSPQIGGTTAGFTMQVVPLKYVGSREMAKILEGVAADPTLVKSDELRNLVILAGTQNEMRHMLDTIEMFDVDWMSGMSIGLFTLQSADVKQVDQDIKRVFDEKGGAVNPLAGVIKLIPIERLNAFVIISPQPAYLEQAKVWLERLDRTGTTGGHRLFVYHVRNGKAEHLADLLNQSFGGQAASQSQASGRSSPTVAPGLTGTELKTSSSPGLNTSLSALSQSRTTSPQPQNAAVGAFGISGDSGGSTDLVRVVADTQNNALLILTNSTGYEKIEAALKKLDTAPRQVLIEVTIAEVTLKDELKFGIEWLFTNGPRRSGKLDTGTSGLNAIVPGFSYVITNATGDQVKSVLNMLASDNNLNILSSPHIMVADNQTAKIQVGDSVPIAGPQTVTGTGTVITSVQYLETGVILSVTPRINASGLVSLDIAQEVSTASETTTSGLNSPTISKRSAKTMVAVQSGETMVLGGLMSEKSEKGATGLPLLSSIPLVGGLFGTQSRNSTRTELVVLITPRVANSPNQAKALSDELRQKMGQAKDLIDCGTSNALGNSTRGGLWCMHPGRLEDSNGKFNEWGSGVNAIETNSRGLRTESGN